MIEWKIKKEKLKNLKFHELNPRKFTKKGLEDLKKSIQSCGDANIITINLDNTVLGGHARLTVMKEMGITEVDVKYPTELLSEEQCKEILVRLNANNAGEWDFDKLEADFNVEDLAEWGFDASLDSLEQPEVNIPVVTEGVKSTLETLVENLPEELRETKLEPEKFEQIVSTFKTERERVIITYPQEKEDKIANMLGLGRIEKVVYTIEEILGKE